MCKSFREQTISEQTIIHLSPKNEREKNLREATTDHLILQSPNLVPKTLSALNFQNGGNIMKIVPSWGLL